MKRFITGRRIAAGLLTLVAIAGLCCLAADTVDGTREAEAVFYFTKVLGFILVPGSAGIGAWLARGWEGR